MLTMPDMFNLHCESLLVRYNQRDTVATRRHIDGLCSILRQQGEVVQTMFGGSVKRGAYVHGLSEVDVLLIVNQSSFAGRPPADAIAHIKRSIEGALKRNPVMSGVLAVTVEYADDTEIQVLPAIRTKNGGIRIAQPGKSAWSKVIQPGNFAEELIAVNPAKNGRVVDTIKLAKAMADCFISRPNRKISGYHMECLAMAAFRDQQGELDPRSMLTHLFGYSIRAVMKPVPDSTGQSRYMDEHLGRAGSLPSQRASTYFGQMRAKVKSSKTKQDMDRLFCEGSEAGSG